MECELKCFKGTCVLGNLTCECQVGWRQSTELLWYDDVVFNQSCITNESLVTILYSIATWSSAFTLGLLCWLVVIRRRMKKLKKEMAFGIFLAMMMCTGSIIFGAMKVSDIDGRGLGRDIVTNVSITVTTIVAFLSSDVSLLKKLKYLRKVLHRMRDTRLARTLKIIHMILVPVSWATIFAANLLWVCTLVQEHQTTLLRAAFGVSAVCSMTRLLLMLFTIQPVLHHMKELLGVTEQNGGADSMFGSADLRRRVKFAIRSTSANTKILVGVHFVVFLFDFNAFTFPTVFRLYVYLAPIRVILCMAAISVSTLFSIQRSKRNRKLSGAISSVHPRYSGKVTNDALRSSIASTVVPPTWNQDSIVSVKK